MASGQLTAEDRSPLPGNGIPPTAIVVQQAGIYPLPLGEGSRKFEKHAHSKRRHRDSNLLIVNKQARINLEQIVINISNVRGISTHEYINLGDREKLDIIIESKPIIIT